VAAIGEPESTMLAESQPNPRALAGLSTEKRSRIIGANGLAPSFTRIRARIKIEMLTRNRIIRITQGRALYHQAICSSLAGRIVVSGTSLSSMLILNLGVNCSGLTISVGNMVFNNHPRLQ
jgi:hypothetical protein